MLGIGTGLAGKRMWLWVAGCLLLQTSWGQHMAAGEGDGVLKLAMPGAR